MSRVLDNFPRLAVIILNWNGLKDTRECLESLRKTDYSNYQIFLVDNGSKGNDAEILKKEYGDFIAVISNETNLGFAEGNNVAIREALEDAEVKYVFLLNNDTTVEPDFLTEAVKAAIGDRRSAINGKIGMVATRMVDYYRRDEVDSLGVRLTRGGLAFNIKRTSDQANERSSERAISYQPASPVGRHPTLFCPCGGAALYSREMLEKVAPDGNYLDPDYFCYAEDLDLGFRGRLAGFDCVLADKSVIYHKGSASTSKMSDFAVYHTYRNVVWTLVKNLPVSLFFRYLPKLIIGQKAIILLYFLRRKPGLVLKAYLDAFKGLPKIRKKRRAIQKMKTIGNKELDESIEPKMFGGK